MAEDVLDAGFIAALFKPSALLPIARHRERLLYVIETFPVTVLVGQTGSGKTTQLPQFLDQGGWCSDGKLIAVTQPRRVAAVSVATRVAEEMSCKVGEEVGYSIRFEDVTSAKTRIKFLTDGLLLREALVDPLLSRYSVIMIDEAHERSLSTDLLLGILKKIRAKRADLRIVISSATLQAEIFVDFFAGKSTRTGKDQRALQDIATVFHVEGRSYPVDILYLETPAEDYFTSALRTVYDIHETEQAGDILVFSTGQQEIHEAVQAVADHNLDHPSSTNRLLPLSLYAGLPTDAQMAVFDGAPENCRKVIFCTNIAEASVTIDGIVYVVDCGFVKLRAYNPATGIESLSSVPVSQASATQRAGRAGRTKAGKCFRLYTEDRFKALDESTIPEIQRSNLAPTILQLKALGIDNIARFEFVSPPPAELFVKALSMLYSLGALDDYAKLTIPVGTRMAELSIEPQMSKALLSAAESRFNCQSEMLSIAAMVQLQGSVWFDHGGDSRKAMEASRRKFAAQEGDHLTLLNVYSAFVGKGKKQAGWCKENHLNFKSLTRAVSIRNQLQRHLERLGVKKDDESVSSWSVASARQPASGEQVQRCLTAGFFAQAARMQPDGTFVAVGGDGNMALHAHPTSLMFNRKADYVVYHEIVESGGKTYIRDITKIEKGWLTEYAASYYSIKGR